MKTQLALACSALAIITGIGCGGSSTSSAPESSSAPSVAEKAEAGAQKAAAAAQDAAKTAVDSAKSAASSAVDAAKTAVDTAKSEAAKVTDAAGQNVMDIIGKARTQATEGKWQEAMASLQQLASVKLSPDQQAIVDNLKKQISEKLSSSAVEKGAAEATKAVGNLLK